MEDILCIKGGKLLSGEILISGSKNLIVSIIPAALLSKDIVTLYNVPHISDVDLLIKILHKLNVKIFYSDNKMIIDSRNIQYQDLLMEEITSFRASYYFMGVMLSLFSKAKIKYPGGCDFGSRPINYHLSSFEQLGVMINENKGLISLSWLDKKTAIIDFKEISVGASVNICLLCARLPLEIEIHNLAIEPEVIELLNFLSLLGVEIQWINERSIIIKGTEQLKGTEFTIIPDRIEIGTYALLGLTIGNNIKIHPIIEEHLASLFEIFKQLSVSYKIIDDALFVSKHISSRGIIVETGPYPKFPTDLQQPLTAYLSLCQSSSIIIENVYKERFAHISELNKMGADIIRQNNMLIIHGVKELNATNINGKDLRGGASLLIAALSSKGTSRLSGLKFINRGYESIITKILKLGANITVLSEEKI